MGAPCSLKEWHGLAIRVLLWYLSNPQLVRAAQVGPDEVCLFELLSNHFLIVLLREIVPFAKTQSTAKMRRPAISKPFTNGYSVRSYDSP